FPEKRAANHAIQVVVKWVAEGKGFHVRVVLIRGCSDCGGWSINKNDRLPLLRGHPEFHPCSNLRSSGRSYAPLISCPTNPLCRRRLPDRFPILYSQTRKHFCCLLSNPNLRPYPNPQNKAYAFHWRHIFRCSISKAHRTAF